MRVLRGVLYMTKSSGPRTEPWGTPQEDVYQQDRSVSHLTRKQLDDRYDLNQLRTEPWIPNQGERWVITINLRCVTTVLINNNVTKLNSLKHLVRTAVAELHN